MSFADGNRPAVPDVGPAPRRVHFNFDRRTYTYTATCPVCRELLATVSEEAAATGQRSVTPIAHYCPGADA